MDIILLLFIFTLAAFLEMELISKVPSQLHTPLMSGSNTISGITIVGAILATVHNPQGTMAMISDSPLWFWPPSMWWADTWSPTACSRNRKVK